MLFIQFQWYYHEIIFMLLVQHKLNYADNHKYLKLTKWKNQIITES